MEKPSPLEGTQPERSIPDLAKFIHNIVLELAQSDEFKMGFVQKSGEFNSRITALETRYQTFLLPLLYEEALRMRRERNELVIQRVGKKKTYPREDQRNILSNVLPRIFTSERNKRQVKLPKEFLKELEMRVLAQFDAEETRQKS